MGRTCRGICEMHKAESVPNKIRYEIKKTKNLKGYATI